MHAIEHPRRDYLFGPVPGDHSADGRFDAEARPRCLQAELTRHRGAALAALAAAGGIVLALRR